MKKTCIIGLGNLLRKDDGIGILLLQKLKQKKQLLPENIELIEAGIPGVNLLHIIEPYNKILFIDAVDFNKKTGSTLLFKPEQVHSKKSNKKSVSIHETDVLKIIEIYKEIKNDDKQFYIFGVQPKNTCYGENLSKGLQKKFDKISEKLIETLNKKFFL